MPYSLLEEEERERKVEARERRFLDEQRRREVDAQKKKRKMSASVLILRGEKKRLEGEKKMTAEGAMKSSGGRRKRKGGQRICEMPKYAGGRNRVGRKKKRRREGSEPEICWSCLAWLELCQILSPALLVGVGPVLVLQVLFPQLAVIRP